MSEGLEKPNDAQAESKQAWGCQPSLDDLYRYMDGMMEPDRQTMVQNHFGNCSGCEDFFHFHSGLQKLVGNRCQTELPGDLSERVFKAITGQPPSWPGDRS